MYLRDLEDRDAPLMLEWMHDKSVVEKLKGHFSEKTIDDCLEFIRSARNIEKSIHLAICSDTDDYMGTVSLKNIDRTNKCAEFAITVRKCSMGRGFSWFGMKEIIRKAFEDYALDNVYWCVSRDNERAIRFYEKHNFREAIEVPNDALARYGDMNDLKWYSISKNDALNERNYVAGCKIIHIKTISTDNAGELSFFEGTHDIGFEIKRIYYISKVPEGVRRGFHAHKKLKQLLFCPYGRIQLILENEMGREEIELSDPSTGVVIDKPTWREMLWIQKDSVLCVAASDFYTTEDYIRNYDEFRNYLNANM